MKSDDTVGAKVVNLQGVSMFEDILTLKIAFRFVFDNEAGCAVNYPKHAITQPGFIDEIAHKVLTWCVGEDYVVNPLLLKDIKEQVAVRLYRPVFGLSAQPKQKEKTDAEREKALKELHDFLGMSPELFMEVHGT